jgi:RNA polymerase sigma factor (TIGR02999 family)
VINSLSASEMTRCHAGSGVFTSPFFRAPPAQRWACRHGNVPMGEGMSQVTRILSAIEEGDPQAAQQLLPLVYNELRGLAASCLAQEVPGQTLQPTALVHEAYLRLVGQRPPRSYEGCGHFFAAAALAMRRILIDRARKKLTEKRGGRLQRSPLESVAVPERDEELLALDEALALLAEEHPEKARLVELRYFGGLTGEEAAQVLGVSPSTADRHWAYARAWLRTRVRGE